jgi:hypothetical protein
MEDCIPSSGYAAVIQTRAKSSFIDWTTAAQQQTNYPLLTGEESSAQGAASRRTDRDLGREAKMVIGDDGRLLDDRIPARSRPHEGRV